MGRMSAFCVPVFLGATLLGFSVTTAHHLDIGALTPGSCGIVDAVDTYAEGLQFKAIKVVEPGRRNDRSGTWCAAIFAVPDLVVGDMEAQIGRRRSGRDRFLIWSTVRPRDGCRRLCRLMDYSERLMRAAIRAIPDGSCTARPPISTASSMIPNHRGAICRLP